MQNENFSAPEETPGGYNFGTFAGVYTPALLTILGLVMFMRTNFVLGNAGLFQTLLILLVGSSITLATGFSISAIATNTDVGGGGAYYLISRVLGPAFGTSIGLTLFVSQSLAIPFNILGATEAIIDGWPELRPYFPLVNVALGAILFFFVWKGGGLGDPGAVLHHGGARRVGDRLPRRTARELLAGESAGQLGPLDTVHSLVPCFAIFFPAVTGIMAGVNMSGDLRDPHRSIPRGTFYALGTAVVLYLIQIVIAAGCFNRQDMIAYPYVLLTKNALFGLGFMVLAGVLAATLSTALGWMLGAPGCSRASAWTTSCRASASSARGPGRATNPRRAIILVAVIVLPILIWSGMIGRNASDTESSPITVMSELVSLFFLFTYAIINLAAFVESLGANPSFRPRFRFFHWGIAAYGTAACVLAAFLIDLELSIVAFLVILGLYIWLRYRNLTMAYGDARRGFVYSRIYSLLHQYARLPLHPKNWRPTIAVLSGEPEERACSWSTRFSSVSGAESSV
ncbi:MAG: hypothetical protein L6W00_07710 [Lentisphaeria bacterium]|nr:MAG: hypothetical protein L6W00_07710 [Lentisphaeria bacterium]